ncbi:alpha/beta fold hydrolase [Allokutzneria sp. NRRL B-24872]|uniref:lipase family alpha/beta hydrolase n=1 Tax=Allokutzneria sp. NRRL B-24872 TaxID=1137961 RepID=UPI00143DF946|nr:alpha/beta fold hydrolase [Allokutzneria sp. NRRL B-24872]
MGLLTPGSATAGTPERGARHHSPVVLVHGWMSSSLPFLAMNVSLRQAGYPVYMIDFPGQDNLVNAAVVAEVVDRVAARHRSRVHVVGHSMGGLSTRHYIKFMGGARHVEQYVSMGSPQYGSVEACLLPESGGGQMCHTSRFMARLNSGDDTPGPLRYTTIRSTLDVPARATWLDGGACFHDIPGVPHALEPASAAFIAAVRETLSGTCPGRFVALPPT